MEDEEALDLMEEDMQTSGYQEPALASFFDYWRSLVTQEARFREQLSECEQRRRECDDLRLRMEDLSREATVKGAGMERLQAELEAAHKDSDCVRQKLRQLQEELTGYRQDNADLLEKLARKGQESAEAADRLQELEKQLLEVRRQRDVLQEEREEEIKIVQEALDEAQAEKAAMQLQFEKLRTVNTDREQQLLDDFEWKLREVEQACKKRIQALEEKLQEKHKAEVEAQQLRSLTRDQQRRLRTSAKQTEQLQVAEKTLKEEVSRLREVLDGEKAYARTVQLMHDQHLAECDRNLQSELEKQRHAINEQWEERMRTDLSRLRSELEKMHDDEKVSALSAVRRELERKLEATREDLEGRLRESLELADRLRRDLEEKEGEHEKELEKTRTNADRDLFDLRRKLDKVDLCYQEKMEKLAETHDREIERLNEEADRRVQQLEQNWQLQMSSTRATLELVKEQMERDAQDRMEVLREQHRNELEQLRKTFESEKEESLKMAEEKHGEELRELQNRHAAKEEELLETASELRSLLEAGRRELEALRTNADLLEGGLQVLGGEVTAQGHQILKVQAKARNRIREREARLVQLTLELRRKDEDLGRLRGAVHRLQLAEEDLRRALADRDRELGLLTQEKRFYQLELHRHSHPRAVCGEPPPSPPLAEGLRSSTLPPQQQRRQHLAFQRGRSS